jgi:hypothetical protein
MTAPPGADLTLVPFGSVSVTSTSTLQDCLDADWPRAAIVGASKRNVQINEAFIARFPILFKRHQPRINTKPATAETRTVDIQIHDGADCSRTSSASMLTDCQNAAYRSAAGCAARLYRRSMSWFTLSSHAACQIQLDLHCLLHSTPG